MGEPLFSLKDVSFSYLGKFPALSNVNIDIQAGQKITVIGANGSGKSTLLQMLDGLLFKDTGEVKFCGKQLNEQSFTDEKFAQAFRRKVGFVFQNPEVQLFCPTVKEDIVFGPLQLGFEKKDVQKRLEELITVLDISALLNRSPYQLSIGEKRKVAIASTLIIDPEVLILDEPTAGLDPQTIRHIIDLLITENLRGKTVITATHDLHIVEEIADLVYVFNNQKTITRFGKTETILNDTDLLKINNLVHIHSHKHKDKVHLHPHLPTGQADAHLDHHPEEY